MLQTYVTMAEQDTRIFKKGDDTSLLRLVKGQRVEITIGALAGVEGIVASQRSAGKVLVTIMDGVYVEVHQFSLKVRA